MSSMVTQDCSNAKMGYLYTTQLARFLLSELDCNEIFLNGDAIHVIDLMLWLNLPTNQFG